MLGVIVALPIALVLAVIVAAVAATPKIDPTLIERVTLAVNPAFPRWVLFTHGTYVIIEDPMVDPRDNALARLREFGPVLAGGPPGDFSVIGLSRTSGWAVSGYGHGIYTFVHPGELGADARTEVEIGLHGRGKRDLDARELRIIHVNGAQAR